MKPGAKTGVLLTALILTLTSAQGSTSVSRPMTG